MRKEASSPDAKEDPEAKKGDTACPGLRAGGSGIRMHVRPVTDNTHTVLSQK